MSEVEGDGVRNIRVFDKSERVFDEEAIIMLFTEARFAGRARVSFRIFVPTAKNDTHDWHLKSEFLFYEGPHTHVSRQIIAFAQDPNTTIHYWFPA